LQKTNVSWVGRAFPRKKRGDARQIVCSMLKREDMVKGEEKNPKKQTSETSETSERSETSETSVNVSCLRRSPARLGVVYPLRGMGQLTQMRCNPSGRAPASAGERVFVGVGFIRPAGLDESSPYKNALLSCPVGEGHQHGGKSVGGAPSPGTDGTPARCPAYEPTYLGYIGPGQQTGPSATHPKSIVSRARGFSPTS
jgi:hypothetical protein